MKRFLLFITVFLLCIGYVQAQGSKLSPSTLLFLSQRAHGDKSSIQRVRRVRGVETISAFMRLNEGFTTSEILKAGVHIVNVFGKVMTVTMPVDKLEEISNLPSVKSINIGETLHVSNDSARIYSHVNQLQAGTSLARQYTGKGVIVGVVDMGVEFDHINFKDADGNSRVKRAYIDDTIYSTPAEIAQLTSDGVDHYHGTHTAGIAAGSYTKNGLQGMAPDADLLLAGLPTFTDPMIINAAKRMVDYADSVGKPIVINFSLGTTVGPKDGTGDYCESLEALKKPGHILVFSNGNLGDKRVSIHHISTNEADVPQFKTVISCGKSAELFPVGLWNSSSHKFCVRLAVIDSLGNELASTPKLNDDANLTKGTTVLFTDSTSLSKYYSGKVKVTSSYDNTNRYWNLLVPSLVPTSASPSYLLALLVYTQKGDTIDAYTDERSEMVSAGIPGYISGDGSQSFDSSNCFDNAITVGSYNTRSYATSLFTGQTLAPFGVWPHGSIAFDSSYGIDFNGVSHPDITAPGSILLSSFNKYAKDLTFWGYVTSKLTENGQDYYWAGCRGTSMACPVVTGIIAQWLQYKPDLSVDEIRTIFRKTAVRDSFVVNGNPIQWGAGKIDAYAGLQYLLTTNIGNPQCAQHQVLIYPSSESGRINVYAQGETGILRVNVYSASGIQVYSDNVSTTDGSASIGLGNRFAKGVYIVKVEGSQAKGSNTLTVR